MTPTAESLDRAREWLDFEAQEPFPIVGERWVMLNDDNLNSLALEFDRNAIEAKIMGLHEGLAIPQQDTTFAERKQVIGGYMDRLRTQLAEHPRQGTALTQKGDSE